jgi:microcystin-dependent protein
MDNYIGEIRLFGGTFAPNGWALCNGQLLPIAQYTALFSIIGTYYGGDGRTNFALPDLRDRVPMHAGQGPGLSSRPLGSQGGAAQVSLDFQQLPAHSHGVNAAAAATIATPSADVLLAPVAGGQPAYRAGGRRDPLDASAVLPTGGGAPHNNLPPVLGLNFIIALQGIWPSRP